MGTDRWRSATTSRGKPRIYIQQFLDLTLPEESYTQIVKELGLSKPFSEESATAVMESFVEEMGDGYQCDAVHFQCGEGSIVLMTVISIPYKQDLYDHLLAVHLAKKALSGGE